MNNVSNKPVIILNGGAGGVGSSSNNAGGVGHGALGMIKNERFKRQPK